MLRYRLSYFGVLLAAVLFYVFFTGYLSFFTLAAIFLLSLASWIFLLLAAGKTSVTVQAESLYTNKDDEFVFHIKIKNPSYFPISMAQLRFHFENLLVADIKKEVFFLSVNARSDEVVEYRMKSRYCGKMISELTHIKYYDALGIFSIRKKAGQKAFVFITPPSRTFTLFANPTENQAVDSSDFYKTRPGDDISEIFDIRPYQNTDRLRSIHWKLSMKLDTLMAKEFNLPVDSSLLLLVEMMAADMAALDTVVETILSLSTMLQSEQKNHRVEWYDTTSDQFNEMDIKNEEDLAVMVSSVLSARRYQKAPAAVNYRNSLSTTLPDCPYAVYITGSLSEGLMEFCCRPGAIKTTVLYCGRMEEVQLELKDRLTAMDVNLAQIIPGRTGESLSGLEV